MGRTMAMHCQCAKNKRKSKTWTMWICAMSAATVVSHSRNKYPLSHVINTFLEIRCEHIGFQKPLQSNRTQASPLLWGDRICQATHSALWTSMVFRYFIVSRYERDGGAVINAIWCVKEMTVKRTMTTTKEIHHHRPTFWVSDWWISFGIFILEPKPME